MRARIVVRRIKSALIAGCFPILALGRERPIRRCAAGTEWANRRQNRVMLEPAAEHISVFQASIMRLTLKMVFTTAGRVSSPPTVDGTRFTFPIGVNSFRRSKERVGADLGAQDLRLRRGLRDDLRGHPRGRNQ